MRLVTKSYLTFGMLLMMAVAGAGAALWSSNQALSHVERIELAHQSYERHLQLSNDSFKLFKEYGDAILVGSDQDVSQEVQLVSSIRQKLTDIRAIITAEIDLVGSEEIEELELLGDIETKFEQIVAIEEDRRSFARSGDSARVRQLSTQLDREIDGAYDPMIEAALEEELEEVAETKAESREMLSTYTLLALLLGFLAVLCAIAALFIIRRDIKRPVEALEYGAKEFAKGNWSHRVPTGFSPELNAVSVALNEAAMGAKEREQNAKQVTEELEKNVEQRTRDLQSAKERLEREADIRKQLLADVSHELRTPLTVIRGETGVALRGANKSAEEYREALGKAKEAAEHTSALVDDLLFVARQEAGEGRLEIKDDDLVKMLRDSIERVQNTYSEDGVPITLNTGLSEALGKFDYRRMSQVMLVLLENAYLYGAPPVEVAIQKIGAGYRIEVCDQGEGISAEDAENIFERFFRGSNAGERYSDGSGLGLPVARSIVEAHGGDLSYEHAEGAGSKFVVILPLRAPLKAVS